MLTTGAKLIVDTLIKHGVRVVFEYPGGHYAAILESLATFPMEFFLLSGDNYVGNNTLGRKCHLRRKIFEECMYKYHEEKLNRIYKFLSKQGIGREFVVIGRVF